MAVSPKDIISLYSVWRLIQQYKLEVIQRQGWIGLNTTNGPISRAYTSQPYLDLLCLNA